MTEGKEGRRPPTTTHSSHSSSSFRGPSPPSSHPILLRPLSTLAVRVIGCCCLFARGKKAFFELYDAFPLQRERERERRHLFQDERTFSYHFPRPPFFSPLALSFLRKCLQTPDTPKRNNSRHTHTQTNTQGKRKKKGISVYRENFLLLSARSQTRWKKEGGRGWLSTRRNKQTATLRCCC